MSPPNSNFNGGLLHQLLDRSAGLCPDHVAVEGPGQEQITYRDLANLSDRLAAHLDHLGVRRGDRVGIYLRKSIDAVACIFGVLKAGGVCVPLDPSAPASRNAQIVHDSSARVLIIQRSFVEAYRATNGLDAERTHLLVLDATAGGEALATAVRQENPGATTNAHASVSRDDLAYLLYTSGSTGPPKGVALSHRNATSFIDWSSETFEPRADDRFSSHAPFHFDLSIFDIFVSIKHGATLVLTDQVEARLPRLLASFIAARRISIWYSTPSVLSLLIQDGSMERNDYSALRLVLFAGEIFPVKHLRALKTLLPAPDYYNLYGPTETTVCTFYKIPDEIAPDRTQPFPIGRPCAHFASKVVDHDGSTVPAGAEGELQMSGPAVMHGYWNRPEQTAAAFSVDSSGRRWYKTGDIVSEDADGNYIYLRRRDRLIKKRGYRIELGEIEACLYAHPAVKEVAVTAQSNEDNQVCISAFLSCETAQKPSVIALKRFCLEHLPAYMIPDRFCFHDSLPKTSTDKTDYQRLDTSGLGLPGQRLGSAAPAPPSATTVEL